MRSSTPPDLGGRCPGCYLRLDLCFCDDVEPFETRTRILVLRHAKERFKSTNTARIALLALPSASVIEVGVKDSPLSLPPFPEGTVLLYPDRSAAPPVRAPQLLVVPDGTWAQSRRMVQRLEVLSRLPRLSLPSGPEAKRLRRSPTSNAMSTIEAIAHALGQIGEDVASRGLLRLHRLHTDRVLDLRGRHTGRCDAPGR